MPSCPRCGHPLASDARICHVCGFLTAGADLPIAEQQLADSPAGFWMRAAASALDSLALFILLFGVIFVTALLGAMVGLDRERLTVLATAAYYLIGIPISVAYFVLQESSPRQATWGKRVLGLYVQTEEGTTLTRGRAIGRYCGKFLSGFTLGIGYLIAAFTPRKQALHDLIVRSVVLRRSGVEPARWALGVALLTVVIPMALVFALVENPDLVRPPGVANEQSAMSALRTINAAQLTFASTCGGGGYATSLADLARAPKAGGMPFIGPDIAGGDKDGYHFVLVAGSTSLGVQAANQTCNGAPSVTSYHVIAVPVVAGASATNTPRSFATNESGVIYANATGEPIANPVPPGTPHAD